MKGSSTQSGVMNRMIALDTMFTYEEQIIIIKNYAFNCFDRILAHIAEAAFYRMGLTIVVFGLCLDFMDAKLHNALLSINSSSNPGLWLLISS